MYGTKNRVRVHVQAGFEDGKVADLRFRDAATMTATMAITWHQGERTGTVEVSSGTKASGLKLCLNAESCPVNMQGSVDIRVRRSANPLSMKKSLGAVINDGDEEVAAHWQLFVDEPPPVVTVPVTTEVQVFTSERSKQLGVVALHGDQALQDVKADLEAKFGGTRTALPERPSQPHCPRLVFPSAARAQPCPSAQASLTARGWSSLLQHACSPLSQSTATQ